MSGQLASSPAEPVRILSDLHLAHPACRIRQVESLRPLIAGAGTVIFNGDSCEQASRGWREAGQERLAELRELCAGEGVAPIFLAGNHDPSITERGWMELAGGTVLLTHGHAIYPEVAPWSHEYLRKKKEIRRLMEERRSEDDDLAYRWETTRLITEIMVPKRTRAFGKGGRKYLMSACWPPERTFNILRVWLGMVGTADSFAARYRPDAKAFLFGHFHRPGVWKRKGRIVCNTGAFMRGSRALLAELKGGRMEVVRIERRDDLYRTGGTVAGFELD